MSRKKLDTRLEAQITRNYCHANSLYIVRSGARPMHRCIQMEEAKVIFLVGKMGR